MKFSTDLKPELVGIYNSSGNDFGIQEDLKSMGISLKPDELDKIIIAVKENIIAKLPEDFQGGRLEQRSDMLFVLYTTKKRK